MKSKKPSCSVNTPDHQSSGDTGYNQTRTKTIQDMLEKLGVSENKLTTFGGSVRRMPGLG